MTLASSTDIRHSEARIEAIDHAAGTMVIQTDPVSLEEAFYEVNFTPRTRVTIDEVLTRPEDLRVNDRVAVKCCEAMGEDGLSVAKVIRVWATRRGAMSYHDPMGTLIWACGHILALDLESGQVDFELRKDASADWIGLKFWEEAGDSATPYGSAAQRLRVVRTWADADDRPVRYRFGIDDGVGVFLNGIETPLSGLRVGDEVGVEFQTSQHGREIILPEYLRAFVSVKTEMCPPWPASGAESV